MMRCAALFLFGMLAMLAADPTPADGQEKKDPALKAPFDQYVKVEAVTAKGEPFLKEMVPAFKSASKTGVPTWRVPIRAIGAAPSEWNGLKSVVVTDKAGKRHQISKITEVGSGTGHLAFRIEDAKP